MVGRIMVACWGGRAGTEEGEGMRQTLALETGGGGVGGNLHGDPLLFRSCKIPRRGRRLSH